MQLYSVKTIAKEFDSCKNVPFTWFRLDEPPPAPPRPYAELIAGYDPADPEAVYRRGVIDELFSAEEAAQLVDYLEQHYGEAGTNHIEEVNLPLVGNVLGFGAFPVGGH
jgi:hypothetical protein